MYHNYLAREVKCALSTLVALPHHVVKANLNVAREHYNVKIEACAVSRKKKKNRKAKINGGALTDANVIILFYHSAYYFSVETFYLHHYLMHFRSELEEIA